MSAAGGGVQDRLQAIRARARPQGLQQDLSVLHCSASRHAALHCRYSQVHGTACVREAVDQRSLLSLCGQEADAVLYNS